MQDFSAVKAEYHHQCYYLTETRRFLGTDIDEFSIFGNETETGNGRICAGNNGMPFTNYCTQTPTGPTLSLVTYFFNDNFIFFHSMDVVILVAVLAS